MYQCDMCDEVFSHSGHIKAHMRIHSREKPYMCSVCNRGFRQSQHMQRHRRKVHGNATNELNQDDSAVVNSRIHDKEEIYQCYMCVKTFSLSEHLEVHMRVHTGEKPYACLVCEAHFTTSSHLQAHECHGHGSANDGMNQDDNVTLECVSGDWSAEDKEGNLAVTREEPDDVRCV